MFTPVDAVILMLVLALAGIVASWLLKPDRLPAGVIVLIVVLLLGVAGFLTYRQAASGAGGSGDKKSVEAGPTSGATAGNGKVTGPTGPAKSPAPNPTPTHTTVTKPHSAATTTAPVRPVTATTTVRSTPHTTAPAKSTAPSPYVSASAFTRFGGTHGAFTMSASGTALTMTVPNSNDTQWGGALTSHQSCNVTISFDVRMDPGDTDYFGFGVFPTAKVADDAGSGDAMLFFQDSDGEYIAELSSVPTPFIGAIGGGSYPFPAPTTTRHIVVSVKNKAYSVTVDGKHPGDYATMDRQQCGEPILAAWGGATVHFDHIEVK